MLKRITAFVMALAIVFSIVTIAGAAMNGRYLNGGDCTIDLRPGFIYCTGHTYAYEYVNTITVELELYRLKNGEWELYWSDSETAHHTDQVDYPRTKVVAETGYYYKLKGIYSVSHSLRNESCDSETDVYYL